MNEEEQSYTAPEPINLEPIVPEPAKETEHPQPESGESKE